MGVWNKAAMPTSRKNGLMSYHDYMLNEIRRIDSIAKGDTSTFLKLFENVKNEVLNNPDMLQKVSGNKKEVTMKYYKLLYDYVT